jgi:hypothetical protein
MWGFSGNGADLEKVAWGMLVLDMGHKVSIQYGTNQTNGRPHPLMCRERGSLFSMVRRALLKKWVFSLTTYVINVNLITTNKKGGVINGDDLSERLPGRTSAKGKI